MEVLTCGLELSSSIKCSACFQLRQVRAELDLRLAACGAEFLPDGLTTFDPLVKRVRTRYTSGADGRLDAEMRVFTVPTN
jgi:hypothetical protein